MRAMILAFCCCLSFVSMARAQLLNIASAGLWTASSGEASGGRVCQVQGASIPSASSSLSAGTIMISAISTNPKIISLYLRENFSQPQQGQNVNLLFEFDGYPNQYLSAQWMGYFLYVNMDSDRLVPFMHGFTAGRFMKVSIVGDDNHNLYFTLLGTTKTINAMSDCTKLAGFTELPRPFVPLEVTQGPLPAVPQPFIPVPAPTSNTPPVAFKEATPEILPAARRDDKCLNQDNAKMVMKNVDAMNYAKSRELQVVDIEEFHEISNPDPKAILTCHGVFIFNNGPKISATFISKTNVAGDSISSFTPD